MRSSTLPMAAHPSRHPPSEALAGTRPRVGDRYEVVERLAHGGMGVVYRVRDALTGEERALKRVSLRDPRHRDIYRAAFEREYQVLASLDHPRIVRVHDYGVDREGPYYTMELVRGRDLRKGVPRPWREVCSLMRDVASSLALLHARRLVYRDLNPGNVKLTSEEHCKLLDFGALTDFGPQRWLVGAPPCIPPEALLGDALDQRADLYALGALMYWALTGRHAFPAVAVSDLRALWKEPARPPSEHTLDLPEAVDGMVLSLLRVDPLARPGSAAEVIAKLVALAKLPPEDRDERRRVAQSFLTVPPFVGRTRELAQLAQHLRDVIAGRGSRVHVRAATGAGRTRLVDELAVRAQIAGATALRVDAAAHEGACGTARALALQLLDLLPDLALGCAAGHEPSLRALGGSVEARLARDAPQAAPARIEGLAAWFVAVARERPLLIAIDDVERCDAESVALLAALAERVRDAPVMLVLVEREGAPDADVPAPLRAGGTRVRFDHLLPDELRVLARSLLGDTPHVERFADWLHDRSAGNPRHALDLVRQLVAREDIRYEAGYWVLPVQRGEGGLALPEALQTALATQLAAVPPAALALAQALALLRIPPTRALCEALVHCEEGLVRSVRFVEEETRARLDALTRHGIVVCEQETVRFRSSALRDAAAASAEAFTRVSQHARLGAALAALSLPGALVPRLEAGWHAMEGGDELGGARLVARTLARFRLARIGRERYPLGAVSERALRVYLRHRRSDYERLPLWTAVAQAVMHDNYALYERHADATLDVLDRLSGLSLARRLRRWLGTSLGLFLSVWLA
ncbi:MAG: serine/threonine-protein kinase, partial [Polyangiales bacterium]